MTDLVKVAKWFASRDTGLSSEAIAWHMTAGWCAGNSPSDPADLGRCLRLLELFPEWKPRISEMAQYSPLWTAQVAHWNELRQCMDEEVGIDWSKGQRAELTYDLMKSIERSAA